MARIGESAQAAQSMSNLTDVFLRIAMMKQQQKDKEREDQLRREMMYRDNARWTAQDTYRREQDGIRQGEAANRIRREDERFAYTKEQDTYRNKQDQLRYEIDNLYKQERDAADDRLKYATLKEKYQADAAGMGGKDIMPQPFTIEANGRKYSGLRNPQTGAYDLDKPEKGPTVRITERDPSGNTSVSRTVGMDEYNQQKLVDRPQEEKYAALQSALAADPDFGANMRAQRRGTQPTGTGAFAPPANAASPSPGQGMGNMDKAAILEEAAKAIQAGKDPMAVKKRLQEMGISY